MCNKPSCLRHTSHLRDIHLNQTSGKLKNSVWMEETVNGNLFSDVMLLTSLDGSQILQNITTRTTMDLWFKIETCNRHQSINLQLIHVVDHIGIHLGWQPLTKISKLTTMAPSFNIVNFEMFGNGCHLRRLPRRLMTCLSGRLTQTLWCLVFIANLYIEWWNYGSHFWDFC